MAHETKIGGTAYEITGGRILVGDTGYDIASGRTLIGGTGYDVKFFDGLMVYDGTFREGEFSYSTFRSGGATPSTSPTISTDGEITTSSVYMVNPNNPDNSCIWFHILYIGTIDVTNYNSLHFEIANLAVYATFGLSTTKSQFSSNYNVFDGGSITPINPANAGSVVQYPYDAVMDISGLTGDYYIKMYSSLSPMIISKIWLE